ncbi:MAG: hypothetical protein COA58_06820 [Bacteroidetes bacterium]|nr:MAG: hypothetical protein COA58_06820 [Bacteroidota bacterium]
MKTLIPVLLLFASFQSMGQCSPTLKEIYDFEVGDQFIYKETALIPSDKPEFQYYFFSYTITKKLSSGDTISYERLYLDGKTDTLFLMHSNNPHLNNCDGDYYKLAFEDFLYHRDTLNQYLKVSIHKDSIHRKSFGDDIYQS